MAVGKITWTDLTVPNAEEVRDFYARVVGWEVDEVDMGGYSDYMMLVPGTEDGAAGICFSKGSNANLPAQWLIYITVADIDVSVAACLANGGSVLDGPRPMGDAQFACIQDPAGAVCALYQPAAG
ncbi:MAG: VOC family protein [Fimbriimonadaceae bacterium]|nr:VOC family protein [Fimbriimonadaceae bacterium]